MTLCGRMAFRKIDKRVIRILKVVEGKKIKEKEIRKLIGAKGFLHSTLFSLYKKGLVKRKEERRPFIYSTTVKVDRIDPFHKALARYRVYKCDYKLNYKYRKLRKKGKKGVINRRRKKGAKYLKFASETIPKYKIFKLRDIARSYIKQHPEINGYKANEQENLSKITRTLAGYFAVIKPELNEKIKVSKHLYKYTPELIQKIQDFLNGKKIIHKKNSRENGDFSFYKDFILLNKEEHRLLCREELDRMYFLGANEPDDHFRELFNEVYNK